MDEELWQRFRARFIETTEKRLDRARAIIARGDPANDALASELHALAGEASILGVDTMASMARAAERAAKSWGAASADVERTLACTKALDDLHAELKTLDHA
jgi:HPt (histidine-containing phosphotransfer) domain-containing protein